MQTFFKKTITLTKQKKNFTTKPFLCLKNVMVQTHHVQAANVSQTLLFLSVRKMNWCLWAACFPSFSPYVTLQTASACISCFGLYCSRSVRLNPWAQDPLWSLTTSPQILLQGILKVENPLTQKRQLCGRCRIQLCLSILIPAAADLHISLPSLHLFWRFRIRFSGDLHSRWVTLRRWR